MIHSLVLAAAIGLGTVRGAGSTPVTVRVDTEPAHRIATIRPLRALGSAIDSDPAGKIPELYAPARTRVMLDAGLGELSYRLYTELSIQDWHWNPAGAFSDATAQHGYWTSSRSVARPSIVDSLGYRLPHRGSTRDQGDDDGYSRIDDGDPTTYWKSDPYLASAYTHDDDATHPQWALIDFGRPRAIDAIRIGWGSPYATRYDVQWWSGPDAIIDQGHGRWHTFARERVRTGDGGTRTRRLAGAPVRAQFFRVVMYASSGTCDTHGSADPRNCMGYAIRELGLGRFGPRGAFRDLIVHSRCGGPPPPDRSRCANRQTTIFVSSIDPWHGAADRNRNGQDQPGLDFVAHNPITRGRPVMYPVPMLYSTPANAVAEIAYLRARGYPVSYVEMGEEADGQYVMPEDYAALFVQFARAIHAVDPSLKLGGPVFEGVNVDVAAWPDARGDRSFLHRFLRYLKQHGALGELAFMSFEHYPFKGCDRGALLHDDLLREPAMIRAIAATWRADGLPADIPMFVTEGNFAADGTSVPLRLEGALWLADYVGSAFSSGVTRIQHYQYEAEPIGRNGKCGISTSYGMFIVDAGYRIRAKAGQFYGAQMLAKEWFAPGDGPHGIFPVATSLGSYKPPLTAYAARRPDGTWSLLFVNKDRIARRVRVTFTGPEAGAFRGTVTVVSFGRAQYRWNDRYGATRLPYPHTGPARRVARADSTGLYTIPPESVTVVRGTTR